MTAIEFLRRYRPNSLVKSSARGEYQLAEHDSFKINGESSVWHWKSRDIGGKSALKYLIYVEGVPFVEAVQLLCEESPMYIPVQHEAVERERPPFRLPNPAPNNDRVTRYLLGRGISLPTIRYCIAGENMPAEVVKSRFLKLNAEHIQYVLDCLKDNPPRIRNIKQYLLATLYNAPLTIENYYAAQIDHDLYGRNRGDVN